MQLPLSLPLIKSKTANAAIPDIKKRYDLKLSHAISAILIWAVLIYISASNANHDIARAVNELDTEIEQQTKSKAGELSTIFRELYVVTRTISLLPAIRKVDPQNRSNIEDDVIDGSRFDMEDAETVQQIYNHAASIASVSEIYVTYEGFRPDLGQVPFLMFDDVIVDRIHGAHLKNRILGNVEDPSDIPEEDESEEYAYLQNLLDRFRKKYPSMPPTAPKGIGVDISPVMITCDNSQYLSISHGNPKNRLGVIISVPIFGNDDGQFKGLVSTIVRTNVFEARLLGWPFIPTTDSEQRQATLDGVDLNRPASNYLLENNALGINIYDRRNTVIPQYLDGSLQQSTEYKEPVAIDGDIQWTLHQLVPRAKIQAITNDIHQALIQRIINITIFLVVLIGGFWLFLQRRISNEMETLASHDSLTELPNRRILSRKITDALTTAHKNQQQTALVMVDLDDFKLINDSIGHAAGDQLLKEVAQRFKEIVRSTDVVEQLYLAESQSELEPIVGRLGGDEFLIVLPNVGYLSQAVLVTERLMSGLAMPIRIEGYSTYIHASMGIAIYPIHGDNADVLLHHADSAMYAAKRKKGNSMVVYNEHLDYASTRHLELHGDLYTALVEEQFVLHYQPMFEVASQRIHTVEALLRWQHPKYGWVLPDEFIPLLEQSGLIVETGEWMLRKICQQLACWKHADSPITRVSMNVSMVQLTQSDFAANAIEILNDEGITPASIMIEVTESVMIDNPEIQLQQLKKLHNTGMQLVLDDFGTGYSSVTHLQKLPVGALKIDCSLVSEMDNQSSRAIVFVLGDLSRRLNIACIAEGVETTAECRLLIEAGCHYIQGQIISKPLPGELVNRLIQSFDSKTIIGDKSLPSALVTSN